VLPNAKINRVHYEVNKYFRAYYAELRKHIATHDPSFQRLPLWFKGGRKVETLVCRDGIIVIHWPYEKASGMFPDKPDSYPLFKLPDELVKERVAKYDIDWPDPNAFPPAEAFAPLIPDYTPGAAFKPGVWPEPRRRGTELDDQGTYVNAADQWTRLDYTNMDRLDAWRDVPRARTQARTLLSNYLEELH